MNEEHDDKLTELGRRVAGGDYVVDPRVVAEAMLRAPGIAQLLGRDIFRDSPESGTSREDAAPGDVVVHDLPLGEGTTGDIAARDGAPEPQDECSYPASPPSPEASVKVSLGVPEVTCPTQLTVSGSDSPASVLSIARRSSENAQIQSS